MKKKLHTTKIVAQYLDLSERRVRQLRDEGVLEEKAPGLYDLRSSVRRYINYLRGDEGGKADLNEERAKLTKEKRIAAETENKVRNGELYGEPDEETREIVEQADADSDVPEPQPAAEDKPTRRKARKTSAE